ncbi:MAG TPA: hypothetical protein VL092_07645, partial [Chitinophagaceae bacterium]|nr:hypothetical protein [Chitinophagaceae bacterium]
MKRFLLLFSLALYSFCAGAQKPERKIIIDGGRFYYFTVDEASQLATLVSGRPGLPLHQATRQALPLGRRTSAPLQPLAFDIGQESIIAVNWIRYPQQHPLFSLKTISLADSSKWKIKNEQELILNSCQQKDVTIFEPWKVIIGRSNVLEQTFFDLAKLQDGRLAVAICNKGELLLSLWDGTTWKTVGSTPVSFDHYFSLFTANGKIMLLAADGSVYLNDELAGTDFKLIKKMAI